MRGGRYTTSMLVVALLAGCGDAGTDPEPTIAEIRVTGPAGDLYTGDEAQLVATVYDSRQRVVQDCEVQWRSGDEAVMTVSAVGRVRARGPGSATIFARCLVQESGLPLSVREALLVRTDGAIFTLPTAPDEEFVVALRDETGEASEVRVAGGASFVLERGALTRKVYVDIRGAAGHLPSTLEFDRDNVWSGLRFVLTPARWHIAEGSYESAIVVLGVRAAFEPPCTTEGEANCDGFYPAAWIGGIKLRDETRPPMPLAFDHGRSASPISAGDSAAFWQTIAVMEADFGQQLFVPATLSGLVVAPDGWSADAVVVRIDDSLSPTSAYANWRWDGDGIIYAGLVRFGSPSGVRSPGLVTHELLHTVGFKHTCSWGSVMGGYGCPMAGRLSASDVAHARLAFAVRAAQRRHGAPFGLVATLNGERGGNYIPAGMIGSRGPALLRLRSLGGEDGAH